MSREVFLVLGTIMQTVFSIRDSGIHNTWNTVNKEEHVPDVLNMRPAIHYLNVSIISKFMITGNFA